MHADSYKQAMAEDRAAHERALKPGGIGYRFVLTSASWESSLRPGETLTLRQEWANRNASWCVYPYRLKLYLLDANGNTAWSAVDNRFDLRPWLGDNIYEVTSSLAVPARVKPGNYDLRIAVVDEGGEPRVRLGIAGVDGQLRYSLGTLTITSAHDERALGR